MIKRLLPLTAILGLAALFLPGAAQAQDKPAAKILLNGNGAEPQEIDPQVVSGTVEHRIIQALFEGLVEQSPTDDNAVIPGVAESWSVSPDGLVYTFRLRADARWSNGDPVTAGDFVRSYRRLLTAELAAENAYMLYLLAGAEDFHTGKLADFAKVGVNADDERTLRLTLRQPAPFLLSQLTHFAWYPVHIPTVEKHGGLTRKGSAWTRPENFVGNGAFKLTRWTPNQILVVERSETYWDRATVKLDAIRFFPVDDGDTEERMFRTGQLHITNDLPLAKIATYRQRQPEVLRIDPFCGIYYYRFNTSRAPFTDARVRRALALSVDRETLVKSVTRAGEQPAYHIVPPGVSGFQSRHAFSADVAEARRLLAEAGFPEGRGFPKVELLYNTSGKHRVIAEALQQMWRRNLGVDISLTNQEWKVYLDSQRAGAFQLQRAGWIADYVDPHVFLDLWRTGGGNNDTRWGSPEYDRLLASSLDAKTEAERFEIYQRMEKILVDEMPVLPIFFYTRTRLVSPKVLHFRTTYIDNFPWKAVDLAN